MKKNRIIRHYLEFAEMEFPYLSRMSSQSQERRITLDQVHQYIKTGEHEDFISLIEVSKQFDEINHDYEKVELMFDLPGVSFSYCHSEEFSWPEHLSYSGLVAFEFRMAGSDDYDLLGSLVRCVRECTVLRFHNHFGGITLVLNVDESSNSIREFPFKKINQFFEENFDLTAVESHDRIDHLTSLRYDPEVYYNPKTIGFIRMMDKWSYYGPKAAEFIKQYAH